MWSRTPHEFYGLSLKVIRCALCSQSGSLWGVLLFRACLAMLTNSRGCETECPHHNSLQSNSGTFLEAMSSWNFCEHDARVREGILNVNIYSGFLDGEAEWLFLSFIVLICMQCQHSQLLQTLLYLTVCS